MCVCACGLSLIFLPSPTPRVDSSSLLECQAPLTRAGRPGASGTGLHSGIAPLTIATYTLPVATLRQYIINLYRVSLVNGN